MDRVRTVMRWPGGEFQFDLVEVEDADHDGEFTDYPVEAGADMTDHFIEKPDRVTLTVYVSNAPLPKNKELKPFEGNLPERDLLLQTREAFAPRLQAATGLNSVGGISVDRAVTIRASVIAWNRAAPFVRRVLNVYDQLITERRNVTPFTVVTEMRDYDSMVVEKLRYRRDKGSTLQPRFEIVLKRINVATLETRDVTGLLPKKESTKKKKDKGKQAPVAADAKTEAHTRSIYKSLFGGSP